MKKMTVPLVMIDREGNIADVDSAQATCVHCGTTTVQTVATCTDGTSLVPHPIGG